MSNAEFHETTYTIPGTSRTVYLKYLLCNQDDITLRSISGSVKDSGYYGINGTFFAGGNLIGIAINNGAQIRNYGTMNRDPRQMGTTAPIACGTYFAFKELVDRIYCGSAAIDIYEGFNYNGTILQTSNAKFAIGGSSLYTSEADLTQSTFANRMLAEDAPYSGYRSRSAILYIGGGPYDLNTVLLTVQGTVNSSKSSGNNFVTNDYEGVTLWKLRNLINTVFSPMITTQTSVVHAIALDGGGSTQIAYKNSYGATVSYQTADSSANNNRTVYSMLSVPM